jgi:hypothetical protein
VRLSFDDPTAHRDQDWAVTYEGTLPTMVNLVADIAPEPDATTPSRLRLKAGGAALCRRGVEDWDVGQKRAGDFLRALDNANLPEPQTNPAMWTASQWTADYVQITDDLLAEGDGYWQDKSQTCWDGVAGLGNGDPNFDTNRYNFCAQTFGAPGSDPNAYLQRDLPILEGHDDYLVVGRFGWMQDPHGMTPVLESTSNRVVVGDDVGNAPYLRAVQCCFHNQAKFNVRAGGEWLTVATSGLGMLHHVQADATGRCVIWHDPLLALLNSRTLEVPWSTPLEGCVPRPNAKPIDRDSTLAMRNPMFSFVMWSGCDVGLAAMDGGTPASGYLDHTESLRDQAWKFSIRGGFSPIAISISQGTSTFVSPQSTRFIEPLGQMAVVDGAQQGLVLIDLNSLGMAAHSPIY